MEFKKKASWTVRLLAVIIIAVIVLYFILIPYVSGSITIAQLEHYIRETEIVDAYTYRDVQVAKLELYVLEMDRVDDWSESYCSSAGKYYLLERNDVIRLIDKIKKIELLPSKQLKASTPPSRIVWQFYAGNVGLYIYDYGEVVFFKENYNAMMDVYAYTSMDDELEWPTNDNRIDE